MAEGELQVPPGALVVLVEDTQPRELLVLRGSVRRFHRQPMLGDAPEAGAVFGGQLHPVA